MGGWARGGREMAAPRRGHLEDEASFRKDIAVVVRVVRRGADAGLWRRDVRRIVVALTITMTVTVVFMRHRRQEMIERVIRDRIPLLDTSGLVERPVDAEVNAALSILFSGLAEAAE